MMMILTETSNTVVADEDSTNQRHVTYHFIHLESSASCAYFKHGRKSRGDGGQVPQEFGVGDTNANCPVRFCQFLKFPAPDCLHYKHYNAAKGLPTP